MAIMLLCLFALFDSNKRYAPIFFGSFGASAYPQQHPGLLANAGVARASSTLGYHDRVYAKYQR